MADRPLRTPRRRTHHRTRLTPVDAASFTPRPDAIDAAALGLIQRLQPIMQGSRAHFCETCGRTIFPGNTAYDVYFQDHRVALVCYECGEGIACHIGLSDAANAPWCLPFGGGPALGGLPHRPKTDGPQVDPPRDR